MINPKGKKLEKLLFGMFDDAIQGVDTYNHNGSLWLIFTDEKQWVVEYTEGGTLWYNYKLFKYEMEFLGMDCVENKEYITRWFEDRFLNKPKVGDTWENSADAWYQVENTIENGVKYTSSFVRLNKISVEDITQNGVKHTKCGKINIDESVENTIENGVKDTRLGFVSCSVFVEDTIQNGVKHTKSNVHPYPKEVRDTIQNGVKHCEDGDWLDGDKRFEDIIQNGEKK